MGSINNGKMTPKITYFGDLEKFEELISHPKSYPNLGERLFTWILVRRAYFHFFLVDFSKNLHCKTPVLQKNPLRGPKFWGAFIFAFFSRSAYYFHFSAFRKFWRALIILRKSSEMTLERLLRGGVIICNTLVQLMLCRRKYNWSIDVAWGHGIWKNS